MGIVVKVKGADFSAQASKFIAPITDGLQYWNFFGATETLATRNLVPGKASSSIVGTLGYGDNYIRPSNGSCIQTLVPETNDQTFIVVYGAEVGQRYLLASGFSDRPVPTPGKPSRGTSLFTSGSQVTGRFTLNGTIAYYDGAQGNSNSLQSQMYNVETGSIALNTMRTTSTYVNQTLSLGGGAETTTSLSLADGQIRDRSAANYRIGYSVSDSDYKDGVNIYAVIMYNRYLSDAEMTTLKTWLRNFYAKKGITV